MEDEECSTGRQGIVGDKAPPGRGIDTVFDTDDTRTHTHTRARGHINYSQCVFRVSSRPIRRQTSQGCNRSAGRGPPLRRERETESRAGRYLEKSSAMIREVKVVVIEFTLQSQYPTRLILLDVKSEGNFPHHQKSPIVV